MKNLVVVIIWLTLLYGTISPVYAGLPQDTRKLTRKEKRELRDKEMEIQFPKTLKLIEEREFILNTEYLILRDGSKIPVDSRINFISVDSTKSTIQTGSGSAYGYNGLGGITADGRVTNVNLTKNDNRRTIYLTLDVASVNSRFRIFFQINADGSARANITTLTSSGSLTFEGKVKALYQAGVFKGDANF